MSSNEPTLRSIGPHLTLTPAAGAFLALLEDLGHLDEPALERVVGVLSAAPAVSSTAASSSRVDLTALRRAAAAVLFAGPQQPDRAQAALLETEWRLLFS